jgi:predicted phosphodiesterase
VLSYKRMGRGRIVSALAALGALIACGALAQAGDAPPGPDAASTPAPAATTLPPTPTAPPTPLPASGSQAVEVPIAPPPTPILFADAPADSPSFSLPPVIRHVTETTVVIGFELTEPADGALVYWPVDDPADQRQAAFDASTTRHQIVLDGLAAGTAYEAAVGIPPEDEAGAYRPLNFLDNRWGPVSFHTPPYDGVLRVGVIGDSGFGGETTYALAGLMAEYDPDLVLHTGDLVYRVYNNTNPYEAFALKWYLPLAPLLRRGPVYPVVGNHDVEPATLWEGEPFYYHAFPPFPDARFAPSAFEGRNQWYAAAYGDVQFLMLDTQTFFGEPGRVEQEAWLAERLADPRFAVTIPVLHVAPLTSGLHTGDGLPVRSWIPLFEGAASRVPLVLSGHDHNYERLIVGGITFVVSGGGSSVLYEMSEPLLQSVAFHEQSHFVLFDVYPDHIDLQAIALSGEVLDEASIPLN